MEFLPQQNRRNEGDTEEALLASMQASGSILATGKRVVIIGGGDTGADCLGTSHRQGAKSVHQFEIMPKPPDERAASTPWPLWPLQLRTESSHEEGGIRDWAINSVKFTGDDDGNVKQLHAVRVGPPPKFEAHAGHRIYARRRSGSARHGLPRSRPQRHDRAARPRSRQSRQHRHHQLHVLGRRRLRRRRHAPRPVARCLGHLPRAAKPPPPSTNIWPRKKRKLRASGRQFPRARVSPAPSAHRIHMPGTHPPHRS